MRDSTNRGWDEQFVDQAWSNMRQLLDEELPVASVSPRWRAEAMLLVFLLGLAFGGIGIIYLMDRPAIGYFPVPQRAVAYQEEPTTRLPVGMPTDVLIEEPNIVTGKTAARTNERTTVPAQAKKEISAAKEEDERTLVISGEQDGNLPPPTVDLPVLTESTVPRTPEMVPPGVPAATEVKPWNNDVPVLAETLTRPAFDVVLQLIPAAELPEWPNGDALFAETLLPPPVIASANAGRFQWGAELGGNYYQEPGYFGGMQLSYELDGRWGLQSGLRYGQIVSGLDDARRAANLMYSAEQASADPNTNLNTNRDQPGTNMPAPPNYFNINIRLQQLSTPVLATYRLSRKWQLGAGVQIHYLLAARRPTQEVAATDNAIAPSFSAYDRTLTGLAAADNTVDTELLRDWNLGAVMGTAFQPTERWSFNLHFQYGFFNWLASDRFLITPTTIQLSAVYRISR